MRSRSLPLLLALAASVAIFPAPSMGSEKSATKKKTASPSSHAATKSVASSPTSTTTSGKSKTGASAKTKTLVIEPTPQPNLIDRAVEAASKPESKPGDASPAAAQAKSAAMGATTLPLALYLRANFPGKYHTRSEWADRGGSSHPVLTANPRIWEPLGTIRNITIHHSAGIPKADPIIMIQEIYFGHTRLTGTLGGSADVAYHFFVDSNGEVWEGRDCTKLGAHVISWPHGVNNAGNIGICGLGTFTDREPSPAMVQSILKLSELIARHEGRPLTVRGHRDWTGINQRHNQIISNCPGKLEPTVAAAQKRVREAIGEAAAPARSVASASPAPTKPASASIVKVGKTTTSPAPPPTSAKK